MAYKSILTMGSLSAQIPSDIKGIINISSLGGYRI
jgi:hypothetical protein